jgi:hypothetical protein
MRKSLVFVGLALLSFAFLAARFSLSDIEWRCVQLGGGWDPERNECVGISLTPMTCAEWQGQVNAATRMCNGARPRKLYCELYDGRWDDETGLCNAIPIKSP